jgi:pimeloyl-ACP methyl ester carboxylesterase
MSEPTERVRRWQAEGTMEEVLGRRLYVQRRPGSGPLLVFLHGFPSSSYDWRAVLELLDGPRVLLLDFLGFGLSEKPREHHYSLSWQADAVEELVGREGEEPVFIVAHDMGTSVTTELFARTLEGRLSIGVEGALLFNGSILLHLASLTIGQKLLRGPIGPLFARLSNERSFRFQFGQLFSRSHPLSAEEAADQWSLLAYEHGQRVLNRTIYYLQERERLTDRWHGAVRDWPGHLSLAWALQDPVATPAVLTGLRELRPGVPVRELPGLGHYPQIEDPPAIAGAIEWALESKT